MWAGLAVACTTEIPEIDFERLACFDDAPIENGILPCSPDRRCSDQGQCVPRLDCAREGIDGCGGGVDPELSLEAPFSRCGVLFGPYTSSVQCESGVYTATSAVPVEPQVCDCAVGLAERLLCVVLAGPPVEGAYGLFVLPEGGRFDHERFGAPKEVLAARRCVRPCSSDASCPAGHTCRPAAVARSLSDSTRNTIGVCYPNRLVSTATTGPPFQPDPAGCEDSNDCEDQGAGLTCQLQVVPTPDHPFAPLGETWSGRRALLGRCVDRAGLVGPGLGCTLDQPQACRSGICMAGRCAALCRRPAPPPGCACRPFHVTRESPLGPVSDVVHLCAP